MRYRTCKFPEHRDTCGVAEIGLELAQLRLHAEPVGHIFKAEDRRIELVRRFGVCHGEPTIEDAAVECAHFHEFAVLLAAAESPDHDPAHRILTFLDPNADRPAQILHALPPHPLDTLSIEYGYSHAPTT